MNIQKDLENWDGKSVEDIRLVYSRYCNATAFTGDIINLLEVANCEKGSSWLLKHHLDMGQPLSPELTHKLFQTLYNLQHWESQLHILQSLENLKIEPAEKESVEGFIRTCLADKNNFVRAWAYHGFYVLSKQYSEYRVPLKIVIFLW